MYTINRINEKLQEEYEYAKTLPESPFNSGLKQGLLIAISHVCTEREKKQELENAYEKIRQGLLNRNGIKNPHEFQNWLDKLISDCSC